MTRDFYDDKKIRKKLFDENPHCKWCSREVYLAKTGDSGSDETASLDHLGSKLGELWETGTVLACRRCNSLRGAIERQSNLIMRRIIKFGCNEHYAKALRNYVKALRRMSKEFTERIKTGKSQCDGNTVMAVEPQPTSRDAQTIVSAVPSPSPSNSPTNKSMTT